MISNFSGYIPPYLIVSTLQNKANISSKIYYSQTRTHHCVCPFQFSKNYSASVQSAHVLLHVHVGNLTLTSKLLSWQVGLGHKTCFAAKTRDGFLYEGWQNTSSDWRRGWFLLNHCATCVLSTL